MTETIQDIYGWDSIQSKNQMNSRWLWCIKHKEQYSSYMTTAGIYFHCKICYREWMKKLDEQDV